MEVTFLPPQAEAINARCIAWRCVAGSRRDSVATAGFSQMGRWLGEGPGRIYAVEPTGSIADDPMPTDKKYPGNPTKSYRSPEPLRVIGELTGWQGHSPEVLQTMKDRLDQLKQLGVEAIDDGVLCLRSLASALLQHRCTWLAARTVDLKLLRRIGG
jgi:hypothetical protein